MAATLNVQFANPGDAGALAGAVQAVVQQAFAGWLQHFDYTTGTYTINVSFRAASQPADASLQYPAPPAFEGFRVTTNDVVVGSAGPNEVSQYGELLGLALTGRGAGPADPGTLYLSPGYLNGSQSLANAVAPIERELGHQFGIQSLRPNNFADFSGGAAVQTGLRTSVYDSSVKFVTYPPDFLTTFNGPNAEAAYGGPVPVLGADPGTTTVGNGQAVDTTTQGAGTIQPLDVALLRDAGVAALSDQELAEHQVARLYVAALGRDADSAGLIQQYAALRSGESLVQVAAGFTSSAEYAKIYGNLSNAAFVSALYQNVLGRAGDAAGVQNFVAVLDAGNSRSVLLAGFADSDEARGYLNNNPNVTYAATAEAQVARLYDTAFDRGADPAGFDLFTTAITDGTSLQQAALSFLASPEFANRYGAAPTNQGLVDELYQNTLQRAPDAAGEALYVNGLASGQLSRAGLLASFSDSQEHIDLMAQAAGARNASGYNTDLAPQLGIIPVIGGPVVGSPVISI